jgi:arylsulfatase A-like enzyme
MSNVKSVLIASTFAIASVPTLDAKESMKPNVVIIYGDDVGYGDVGAYGSKLIPTPNIDRLASEGVRFTDGHCAASTCTPSRFSMLTGMQAFRRHGTGILPGDGKLPIKTTDFTFPKLFKKAGYSTAAIGKWHLGLGDGKKPIDWNKEIKPGPLEIGFDYCFLAPATNDRVPCVYLENHRIKDLDPNDPITVSYKKPIGADVPGTVYPDARKNPEAMSFYKSTHGHNNTVINGIGRIGYMKGGKSALWSDETMSETFLEKAKEFITKNKKKPFFLYFASQCIHVPRVPAPRFRGKTKLGYRGDSMVEFDWVTGEIVKTLEKLGIRDNTIIIFSSDNGPVYDDGYDDGTKTRTSTKEFDIGHDRSGPYRRGKYQIFEGGTRIPFIVSWPGKIKPGVSNALISQVDFVASFADLLGIQLKKGEAVDSVDRMATLMGLDKKGAPYIFEQDNGQTKALRYGSWKYVPPVVNWRKKRKPGMLFNLEKDIAEKHNVLKENPEKVKELEKVMDKLIKQGGIRQK